MSEHKCQECGKEVEVLDLGVGIIVPDICEECVEKLLAEDDN